MRVKLAFAMSFALMLNTGAQASAVVNVQGTLLPPACQVDDGANGDIQVDFGDDININRLNGNSYRKAVTYRVSCGTDGQNWPLRLRFEGAANAWDSQSLATSDPNLGIRLLLNGTAVNFGADYPVPDSSNLPVLIAAPVGNSADAPQEGAFTATASLLAEYY
ncbi:putative minor fimbrial subunit StfF [Serratia quinivorans]|nr:putative minor fimbrial subunit StfF [Serratia quinivorans]CAI1713036.1 putative minor fimbrial subunit StfF [Serratia quinivorans]